MLYQHKVLPWHALSYEVAASSNVYCEHGVSTWHVKLKFDREDVRPKCGRKSVRLAETVYTFGNELLHLDNWLSLFLQFASMPSDYSEVVRRSKVCVMNGVHCWVSVGETIVILVSIYSAASRTAAGISLIRASLLGVN